MILILAHRSVAASSYQIITAKSTISYILYGIALAIIIILFTQEIMYGESITRYSNFKGLQKHRKNAGLFIHCGVVAMSTQTIAISLLFLQKCRLNRRVNFGGFSGSPNKTMKFLFLFIMAIWSFFDNFYPQVA